MGRVTLMIDGVEVTGNTGDTVLDVALDNDIYIPHLCAHPDLAPFGNCRACMVRVNGRLLSACTHPVSDNDSVESNCADINRLRQRIIQMLFVEGNHFCPSCELSGNCQLQALAYLLEMKEPFFHYQYPKRQRDGSHKALFLDRDRCIQCGLCVRANRELDGGNALELAGRGASTRLIATSESGRLKDTELDERDHGANICPVGALLHKRGNYSVPIGERLYDNQSIDKVGNRFAHPYYDDDHEH